MRIDGSRELLRPRHPEDGGSARFSRAAWQHDPPPSLSSTCNKYITSLFGPSGVQAPSSPSEPLIQRERMQMTERLKGKRAFITGAAHGIGAKGAMMFAREG